jgi:hypothetical protein
MDWDLLSSYAGLLSLATVSIYAGAFSSLPVRDSNFPIALNYISLMSVVRNPHESRSTLQESPC